MIEPQTNEFHCRKNLTIFNDNKVTLNTNIKQNVN
jgi:hypothetical protein